MKNIIYTLLFLTISAFSQDVVSYYPLKQSGVVNNTIFYDDGKIVTNNIISGNTYKYEKCQIDFETTTNSTFKFQFSDGTLISLAENSQLKLHNFSADIKNNTSIPSILKCDNQNYAFSLMSGILDVVNTSTNGVFMLQTPRVSMTLKNGKYRVVVQDKTTVLAVITGKAIVHRVIESKELSVTNGNFAHISTYYSLSLKGMDTINNGKPTAVIKSIQPEDIKTIEQSCDDLMSLSNEMIFALIDKKVVGIKLVDKSINQ